MNDQALSECHQMTIVATSAPELAERILRVIRHRGFVIQHLAMSLNETKKIVVLDLMVNSHKPISLLINQLHKVVNVQQIDSLPLAIDSHRCATSLVN